MILRDYQRESIDATYQWLRENEGNPCIVLPTGAGKTPVLATICADVVNKWNGRVLVLAHVKELLEQSQDKLAAIDPSLDVGVYSAGLNERNTTADVIVAGIQSVYRRMDELGEFKCIIVDEAHLIPPRGTGRYMTALAAAREINPALRVIGLTATPYRTASGHICEDEDHILDDISYEARVDDLIDDGYLCDVVSCAGAEGARANDGNLHKRGGEFIESEVQEEMMSGDKIEVAIEDIIQRTQDRQSVLIFCSGIEHALYVQNELLHQLPDMFARVETVTGDTPAKQRAQILGDFKDGAIKFLVNVNVLTTGFDAPNIDAIALLRPTASPGLYYQMVGRGLRLHDSKSNCLILDYGGNVRRHGPINDIRIEAKGDGDNQKECPGEIDGHPCGWIGPQNARECPLCGFSWAAEMEAKIKKREEAARHQAEVEAQLEIIERDARRKERGIWYDVKSVEFSRHQPRNLDKPVSFRVDYHVGDFKTFSEWVCFEHVGYAQNKAFAWWKHMSRAPIPDFVSQAVALQDTIANITRIKVKQKRGDKFPSVVDWERDKPPEIDDAHADFEGFDWRRGAQIQDMDDDG